MPSFPGVDYMDIDSLFSEEELMVRQTVRDFVDEEVIPIIEEANREGRDADAPHPEDGRDGPLRRHHQGVRPPRPQQRRLRPDHAGAGARRFRPALVRVGAVGTGDVSDLHLRLERTARLLDSEARRRRKDRLLRPDRARLRLQSRRHAHVRAQGRRLVGPQRREGVDHERLDRRRGRGLGQARRRHPRLPRREGHARLLHRLPHGQVLAARLGDLAALLRGLPHPRRERAARNERHQVPARLPDPGPLRHRLGRPRRGDGASTKRRGRTRSRASSSAASRSPRISSCRTSWPG